MFIFFPQKSPLCLVNVSYISDSENISTNCLFASLLMRNHSWWGEIIKMIEKAQILILKEMIFPINEKGALNIEIWRKQIIDLLLISPKCEKWRGKYVFFLKITSRITITHLTDFCWSSTFPGSLNEFTVSSQSLLLL